MEVCRLLAAEVSALFLLFPFSFCHQRQLIQWETAKVMRWWPLAFYYSLSLSLSSDPADPTAKVAPFSLSPSLSLSLSLFLSPSKPVGHNDSRSNQRWRRWLPPLSLSRTLSPSLPLALSLRSRLPATVLGRRISPRRVGQVFLPDN